METTDSAFFATNGRLHGEPSTTPITDAAIAGDFGPLYFAEHGSDVVPAHEMRKLETDRAALIAALHDAEVLLSGYGHTERGVKESVLAQARATLAKVRA